MKRQASYAVMRDRFIVRSAVFGGDIGDYGHAFSPKPGMPFVLTIRGSRQIRKPCDSNIAGFFRSTTQSPVPLNGFASSTAPPAGLPRFSLTPTARYPGDPLRHR